MNYVANMKGKWGLFSHFLGGNLNSEWESRVNAIDVKRLAADVASTGASWYGITIHQQTSCFCAPNETFERLTGIPRGEGTVHRDLPMEIGLELQKYGIDLMLYHTADGPAQTPKASEALGGYGEPINETYFSNWLEVLRDDAERYRDLAKYWWIDGCYPHYGCTAERLRRVSELFHSANPDYAVALNYYGCARVFYDPYPDGIFRADWFVEPPPAVAGDDFAAGEVNLLGGLPMHWSDPGNGAHVLPQQKDVQWHILAFLGEPRNVRAVYDGWGASGCKYNAGWLQCYRRELLNRGGALTLDCHICPDGSIDPQQLAMLQSIAE